ncbi:hypothetical protein BU26DRAFT_246924 [Trematosphaeria pertusa]|uniref:Uncharacterized protein n=1 Tax=Trematosphaeria pertusa TaxID=390896 RepID=A0A6A6IQR6_9PLEO|nr:uncharacterized protein BU26DRAFT_246924 [Trematosphaeria pertusa]KAF2251920.1 hypothetical protein BU26DRAFT_246924 [Trematosphaeria pertusa]
MQPDRRMSDPPHLKPPPNPFDAFVKAHTDTAVPTLSTDPAARRRIGEWLLDYMKNNAIQRTVYLGILKELGIVDPAGDPWEDRALEYWTTDSNEQPARLVQDKPPLTRFTSQCPNFDEESKSPLKFPSSDPSPSHSIPFFPPDLSPNDIYEPGSPLAGINTPDHVEVSSKPLVPQLRIRIKTPEAETNGVPVLKYDTPPDHNEGAGSIPSAPFHGLENNTAQLPIPSHNSSSSLTSRRHDSHQDLGALVVAEGVGPCTESTSPQQLLRPEDSVAISERPRATSNPECRRHVMRPNGSEIAESCSQKRMQNVDRTRKEGEPAMAESIRATSVSSFRSASPFSTLGPGPFHTANHPPISPGKQHCSTYLRVNSNIPGYHGPASEWSYPPEKQEKHWTERIRSHIKTRSSSSLFYRSSQYT